MSRSDVIPIDSRSHLEVADRKHRYAKNLRTYFKEYHRINGLSDIVERSAPNNENATPSRKWTRYEPFFEWLDKEESAPNLPDCPRTVLDEDRVEYLTTQAEREPYEITINGTGLGSSDADNTAGEKLWRMTQTGEPVNTGSKGWIFVLLNGRLYACEKRTNTFPRFHHSSFFAGASVSAAGMLVCVNGKLTKLFPHSGHYRPLDRHLYSLLAFLRDKGVDLSAVQVDVQRVMKLSRAQDKDGGKAKKTDSAFYLNGETAYHFLKSKTGFQECGALRHINKRRLDYTEGEESAPVKAKTAHVLTVSSPTVAADGPIESRSPLSPVETEDALGQLPVLQKADSGDGPPYSPSERNKLRLSIAPSSASNRSSLNMNRLSLSSTGGYASTVGSTSPFCSPIAQHNLYLLHGSSSGGGGGGGEGRREQESADTAVGHRLASTSNDSAGGGFDPSRTIKDSFSQSHSGKNNNNINNNNNSDYNTSSKGLFGSTSGDEYSSIEALLGNITHNTHKQQQHQEQQQPQDLFGSGGRSSADARARLLNTMLYADPAGVGTNATELGSTTTTGRNKESMHSTSLPLPPSPPVPVPTSAVRTVSSSNNNNSNSNNNGSGMYVQTAVITPALKIPVAAPIKKVTSYSSISSSYGSSSFAQPQPVYGNRSRSTSKADHDLDYDLRMLLGESPIVQAPDVNYFNYDVCAASPVNALTGNGYNQYNINTNSNSTCNSRGRSRGSSYNPPYIPSATTTNNNNSSSNALASVGYNLHNSVSNNSIAGSGSGSGHNTRSNSLYGGTTGTNGNTGNGTTNAVKDPSSSEPHSPVVDKYSPRSSIGSTSAGVAAAAGNTALSNNISKANNSINSTEKKVDPSTGAWSPPSGKGGIGMNAGEREEKSSSSRSASARLFSEDVSIPTGASIASVPVYGSGKSNHFPPTTPNSEKLTAGGAESTEDTEGLSPPSAGEEGLYAGSPQPSFASSLSSTDSLPNMMLNYVMSPGGTTLHRYFDGQGEGDGMYEAEVLGDSYHDHLYGDNDNEA
uniref:Uncharacterized protein n=1 Tax=Spumella elongata TaxID=89044 RepID=A0A7S3HL12_9STRA|mmetsp:Transcript_5763/g.9708  ORF Transcript_5763/g.9708 Transcript_5763/m.9708 type:complete len:1027 (+) Transcript_5763:102-3182(+)|eukprot:CAMPEP_0184997524 /NCGR_PEP_ID=MMETSP1098-20130426/59865_1 /TAXON_ID=89044 /ORGANISM="Spumella elongata, Strain CCAP 955/1" /LENGTH=1026 /DNA_ID=CAMNT_0027524175 /DNA_START=81 /DNA_END=3161 /DNA_ORIENTATION=+